MRGRAVSPPKGGSTSTLRAATPGGGANPGGGKEEARTMQQIRRLLETLTKGRDMQVLGTRCQV